MQKVITYERQLSKFQPLEHILCFDDFDKGNQGWLDLKPNFVGEDFAPHQGFFDHLRWGPPMLSTATFRFPGTHGSMEGTYSLKLATRAVADRYEKPPRPGSMGHAIKRLARPSKISKLQMEMWFAYKAEQDRPGLGENAIRAFGMVIDNQNAHHRSFPGVRYLNAVNGELKKYWQVMEASPVSDKEWAYGYEKNWGKFGIDPQWYGRRYANGSGDGFKPIPNGHQELIYNETDGKINWMYMRLLVDVENYRYIEFQSGDQTFDISEFGPTPAKKYDRIHNLINPVIFIETDTDRRVFLYVDSVVISVE